MTQIGNTSKKATQPMCQMDLVILVNMFEEQQQARVVVRFVFLFFLFFKDV